MTDGQIVLLMVAVAAVAWLFKRKKKTGEVFFIEIVEIWERAPKKRTSPVLINLAIVGGIVLFLWVMAHGQ